jgi:hypothetical protein
VRGASRYTRARATATFLTLLDSAKRAKVNLWHDLVDLLAPIASHPINQLADLLPNNGKPATSAPAQALQT